MLGRQFDVQVCIWGERLEMGIQVEETMSNTMGLAKAIRTEHRIRRGLRPGLACL